MLQISQNDCRYLQQSVKISSGTLFVSPFFPDDVIRSPDLRLAAAGARHIPEALLGSRRASAAA